MANNEFKLDFSNGEIDLTSGGTTKTLLPSGRLIKLNAAENGSIEVNSGADLDNETSTRIFSGSNMINAPSANAAGWWYVEVLRHNDSNGYVQQTASGLSGHQSALVFRRVQVAGVWSGWAPVSSGFIETTSTSNTYLGQWTKIATIRITQQYVNTSMQLDCAVENHGATNYRYFRLALRVKQQVALGGLPYVDLRMVESSNTGSVDAHDIGYTITQNDATATEVDFYVRINTGFSALYAEPRNRRETGVGSITLHSLQPYTTTAPSVIPNEWGGSSWTPVTFQNGWSDYGTGWHSVSYKRDNNGIVRLRGLALPGTWDSTIFNLPAGMRPSNILIFPSVSNSDGLMTVRIDTSGNVYTNGGGGGWCTFEGINFEAEQ